MKNYELTELEKQVLKEALSDGFAYDGGNETFLTWGFGGKRERGAVASLVKKGVLNIFKEGGDVYVYCGEGLNIGDIEELAGLPRKWTKS